MAYDDSAVVIRRNFGKVRQSSAFFKRVLPSYYIWYWRTSLYIWKKCSSIILFAPKAQSKHSKTIEALKVQMMAYDSKKMLSNLKMLLTLKFLLLGYLIAFNIGLFLRQRQDSIGNYIFKL